MKKVFLHLVVSLFIDVGVSAQRGRIDSLLTELHTSVEDTNKVKIYLMCAGEFRFTNPDSAIILSAQALKISKKDKWLKGIGNASHQLGEFYWRAGNYPKALENDLLALDTRLKLKDSLGTATTLGNIGILYASQKDYENALKYYNQALTIGEKLNDNVLVSNTLGIMANVFMKMDDYTKALDCNFKALEIRTKTNNKKGIAISYGNVGLVYICMGDSANSAGNTALALNVFYPKAFEYYAKALKICNENRHQYGIAVNLGNLGEMLSKEGDLVGNGAVRRQKYLQSEKYLIQAIQIADSLSLLDMKMEFENSLCELYSKEAKFDLALQHYKIYINTRDILFNQENSKKQTKLEMQYEFDKKTAADSIRAAERKKHDTLKHNQEIQQQKLYTYGGISGFALMLIVALVSIRAFRNKQKANEIISHQKAVVEEKQKEILDSIHYAKRIQQSLMPSEKYIEKHLPRTS